MIFSQLEPFGSQADFMRSAIIASTVANAHRGKKGKKYKADDFMPKFERKKEQPIEDVINFVSTLTQALGGEDKR